MTIPTNWPNPERPGAVMWPDKDGRHLFALGGGYIVAFWRADKQWLVCDDDHDLGFCASERVKDLHYIGPVLTSTQIAEMLAGERERCAQATEKEKPTMDDALRSQRMNSAFHAISRAAANIRNLGAAR